MKRKREVNLNTVKKPNENQKPKSRRVKKLTLSEKIRKESPENVFVVNEIVLATVPGYCAWPSRILSIRNETIMVEFFGTGQV